MTALNSMAVAISGLVFAGAAALTAGVATSASAEVAASTPRMMLSGGDDESQAISQVNDCGNGELPLNVFCQNLGSQIQGKHNSASLSGQQQDAP